MNILPWVLVCILFAAVLLLIKICLLRKAAEEIEEAFADRLATGSNALISISCRDARMRSLADSINTQLKTLRQDRQRFQQGDLELKEAITNISHDLRTPLAAICGYLDLLDQESLPKDAIRALAVIRERTNAMKFLTEELFHYSIAVSTLQDAPPEEVILNYVLEESLSAHYAVLKDAGITPDISIPEKKLCRRLNKNALSRIFSNIISNAVKYSTGDFSVRLSEDGLLSFSNKAPQLDEVRAGKLFDRFYTVETAAKSTGLGLSIAKILTQQMGGRISAEYADGTLHIFLSFPPTCPFT